MKNCGKDVLWINVYVTEGEMENHFSGIAPSGQFYEFFSYHVLISTLI